MTTAFRKNKTPHVFWFCFCLFFCFFCFVLFVFILGGGGGIILCRDHLCYIKLIHAGVSP